MANTGRVSQIIGPAVDVEFDEGKQPPIHTALHITSKGFEGPAPIDVIVEVQQHLGEGRVRCIALQPTDGMVRGMPAEDLKGPVSIPVGKGALGRVMNVIGEPVDKMGPIEAKRRDPIHRPRHQWWIRTPRWKCSRPGSKSSILEAPHRSPQERHGPFARGT